jgi:hypothetical protein
MKQFWMMLILLCGTGLACAQPLAVAHAHLFLPDTIQIKDTWWGGQRYQLEGDYLRQRELKAMLRSDREAWRSWQKGQWWHWSSVAVFASCFYVVRTDRPNWSWALLGSSVLIRGVGYGQKHQAVARYNLNRR